MFWDFFVVHCTISGSRNSTFFWFVCALLARKKSPFTKNKKNLGQLELINAIVKIENNSTQIYAINSIIKIAMVAEL